jgi:prefoldin subunit 5
MVRAQTPPRVSLPATIALSLVSALITGVGSWYAIKNDIANAIATETRNERRIERLENDRDASRADTAKRDTAIALVVEQLKTLNDKITEANDHLGRIEDRQVKVIMPAVTGNSTHR